MIPLLAAVLGVALGVNWARKRGGNTLDKAQHGAVLAIVFALIATILSIVAARLA